MKPPPKKVIIAAVAVVVLAVAAILIIYTKASRDAARYVTLTGNMEATEVHVAFKISGRIAKIAVAEGDAVTPNQEVSRLVDDELLATEAEARAAVEVAKAAEAQVAVALDYARKNQPARIAEAKAMLDAARQQLVELEHGSREQEIQRAAAQSAVAKAELDLARTEWERAQKLLRENSIPESQRDAAKAAYEKATAAYSSAVESQALIKEGPRQEAIATARAKAAEAEAAESLAEQQTAFDIARNEQERLAAQAQIGLANAQLAVASVQLSHTRLTTPLDGRVVRKNVEEGELVVAGTPVLTIADIRHPWVRAFVNEQDLPRLRLGQKAMVDIDSRNLRGTFPGRVTFISEEAEFTPKNVETRAERVRLVYRIKVTVDNPEEILKAGMPVTVEIDTTSGAEAAAP